LNVKSNYDPNQPYPIHRQNMKAEEFKQLEDLLSKLHVHLGYRYCIIPSHIQDSPYISLYDDKGNMIAQAESYNLESTVKEVLQKVNP
jgi:predicted amidophosphoribosyltransferase